MTDETCMQYQLFKTKSTNYAKRVYDYMYFLHLTLTNVFRTMRCGHFSLVPFESI